MYSYNFHSMKNPKEKAKPREKDGKPKKPHDMMFRVAFKRPNLVREVIEAKAPKELLAILHLDTLRLSDTSYVDEKLSEDFVDVVLTCETNQQEPVELPFIWEHKSYVPSYPNRQIMRYQDNVWDYQISTKGLKPTPVIPFLFYHGDEEWAEKKWGEFLKGWREEFAPYTPPGGYILIRLNSMTDEEIKQFRSGFLRTALLLMKHRFEREFLLGNLLEMVNFVETDSEEEDYDNRLKNLRYIIRYLQGLKTVEWEEVKATLNKNNFSMQAMTIDEELSLEDIEKGIEIGFEKGFEKGTEKGMEKGMEIGSEKARLEAKFFSCRNMLLQNFTHEVIAGVLEVTMRFVREVAKQLVKEPKIRILLEENKYLFSEIAEKTKVSILLVEAIKKDMDKAMQQKGNGKVH